MSQRTTTLVICWIRNFSDKATTVTSTHLGKRGNSIFFVCDGLRHLRLQICMSVRSRSSHLTDLKRGEGRMLPWKFQHRNPLPPLKGRSLKQL